MYVINFLVTFLLSTTNTALYFTPTPSLVIYAISIFTKQNAMALFIHIFDPPGRIGGHYLVSVRCNGNVGARITKYALHLLAVAWWVILNSPDLSLIFLPDKREDI